MNFFSISFRKLRLVAMALGVSACSMANAQAFPEKPITMLVPLIAGTAADTIARALADEMSKTLKQPIIVDNRPGAGEVVAATILHRAPPNGHTLMISLMPNMLSPAIQQSLPFRSIADFAVVGSAVKLYSVLAVGTHVPANNFQEFLSLLQTQPNHFTYGSSGVGSAMHLHAEAMNKQAGRKSVHVPYKSFQIVTTDLAAQRLDYAFTGVSISTQFAREGKIKMLGVSAPQRLAELPDVPTLAEQGLPGFEGGFTYSVLTTKGTPAGVIDTLNKALNAAVASEAFKSRMKTIGGAVIPGPISSAEVTRSLIAEEARWRQLVKELNIVFE